MADKFAQMPSRILQCFVVAFTPTSTDGERINALRSIDQYLKGIQSDQRDVIERITTAPPSQEDLLKQLEDTAQQIFNAGAEFERQQRAAPPPSTSFFNSGPSRSSLYAFDDGDRVGGQQIHNGYTWSAIAGHCYDNMHCIPDKHHGFLEDMADRLTGYGTVSGKQAKYLNNLFNQYLAGRI